MSAPVEVVSDDARHVSPFSTREKLGRLAWSVVQATAFRCSFTTWYRYRVFILRLFGAKVHITAHIRRTARFECPWNVSIGANTAVGDHAILYALGPIIIGRRVSVSQYSHLCAGTHDFTKADLPLIRPPIRLEDDAWLGADTFVGPGVVMHQGALLGARGAAFKDLEAWHVYGGNPARLLRRREAMQGRPAELPGPPWAGGGGNV